MCSAIAVVLVCISLMADNIEDLFISSFAISMSFLSFVYFLIGLVVLLPLNFENSLF